LYHETYPWGLGLKKAAQGFSKNYSVLTGSLFKGGGKFNQAVCKHFIWMIKSFEARAHKVGSAKLETVKVTGKTMIKALEYLQDLGYSEPESIRVMEAQVIPKSSE
tara:strand:+ start:1071 stop:1388 length:318 start_codon:yes stop_codon:yes gene_type:complete